jgi:hypothetical protein
MLSSEEDQTFPAYPKYTDYAQPDCHQETDARLGN